MERLPYNNKKQFLLIFINLQPLEMPTRSKNLKTRIYAKCLKTAILKTRFLIN